MIFINLTMLQVGLYKRLLVERSYLSLKEGLGRFTDDRLLHQFRKTSVEHVVVM